MASEEEAETAGGAGEVIITPTETAEYLEGSGAENDSLGTMADGVATWDTTSEDADAAGARAAMGQRKGKGRSLPACGKNRLASPPEWVKEKGVPRPLEWWKTPGSISRE